MVLVAGLIFVTSYFHHGSHVAGAPTARQHSASAEAATSPGNGLVIRKVSAARTVNGLVVEGEIANLSDASHQVSRLRLALQDPAEKEVGSKIVDPPKTKLEPGEVEHFETLFPNPPDTATGVVVTFVSS